MKNAQSKSCKGHSLSILAFFLGQPVILSANKVQLTEILNQVLMIFLFRRAKEFHLSFSNEIHKFDPFEPHGNLRAVSNQICCK